MASRTTTNRSLLALVGLILLGGGLLVLFAGFDLYRRLDVAPPAAWPLTGPDDVLLGSADRLRWSDQGWWWWPAVIAALVLTVLLALWWLFAQLRRRRPGALPVGGTPRGKGWNCVTARSVTRSPPRPVACRAWTTRTCASPGGPPARTPTSTSR